MMPNTIVPMQHFYEFHVDSRPVLRINSKDMLMDADIQALNLMIAQRENVHITKVMHTYEYVNITE